MTLIRKLKITELMKIKEIDASQYIGKAWREIDGIRQLITIDYLDPDWPNGFDHHFNGLKNTLEDGGLVMGAFDDERLLGIISVNRPLFGEKNRYVLLDQLFISNDQRGKGLGKKLFFEAADIVKGWHATKFYICAGSAEETVAFYKALGCCEVEELNQALYEDDPRDMHLEYSLGSY